MKEKEIDIIQLDYPLNVRTRPGMYIGSTHCPDVILREAIDNSIDELMGSIRCSSIDIQVKTGRSGGWYVVSDNGRGIPILIDKGKKVTKTELAVASLNAGSKFKKGKDDVATGLNGVGISCTNALSSRFVILSRITSDNYDKSIKEVKELYEFNKSDDNYYYLEFKQGEKIAEGALTRYDAMNKYEFQFPEGSSTITAFIPDPTIWTNIEASYNKRSLAYIDIVMKKFYNKTSRITIDGELISSEFSPFKYEFTKDVTIIRNGKEHSCRFYVNFDIDKDLSVRDFTGSVNSLIVDRGLHVKYIQESFSEAIRRHYGVGHNQTLAGLHMNVIAMCSNVDYSSQTKENCVRLDYLWSTDVVPVIAKEFIKIFKANPEYFDAHNARLTEYANSLVKISTINLVKSMVVVNDGSQGSRTRAKVPANVRDAGSSKRSDCELIICEGKSASGTILRGRDAKTQAVMELRGVPMNAVNASLDDLLANEEMKAIISAIGVGVNEYHSLANPRYGKIIIAADADSDGLRISSMIIGMIAKKMTFLIKEGMVYVLNSPLYKQNNRYIYPTDNIDKLLDKSKPFERYKGLGEIPLEDAKRCITGSERQLIKITLDNVAYALDLLTSTGARKQLMIDKGIVIDKYQTGEM